MSDFDAILSEYLRLSGWPALSVHRALDDGRRACRYVPSSTQEPSEETARLRERLKHRLVELASRPASAKPAH